jgi:hypothetical protein
MWKKRNNSFKKLYKNNILCSLNIHEKCLIYLFWKLSSYIIILKIINNTNIKSSNLI